MIVFTVFDDTFSSSSNITLSISTIDDHPTVVSVNGSGHYSYSEGNPPVLLAGILLDDEDARNSDVTVNAVTIEVIGIADNEILEVSFNTSNITVSKKQVLIKVSCIVIF